MSKIVPRVLLQHGWFTTPESWITECSKKKCLPYVLADLGYDVWIGTQRGTMRPEYSDNLNFNPISDSKSFWGYSLDDMAQFDFPTLVNFVIKNTPVT